MSLSLSSSSSSLSLNLPSVNTVNEDKKKRIQFTMNLVIFSLLFSIVIYIVFISLKSGISLFSWHPICMSIAFLIVVPEAIGIFNNSSYLGQGLGFKERVQKHWILQLIAIGLVSIGFIVIYVNKNINGKSHFLSYHGIIGLITVITMAIVSCGGIFAKYSFDLRNYIRPVLLKITHSFFGALLFLLAFGTTFLGFYSHWYQKFGNETLKYVFGVILLVALVNCLYRPVKLLGERFETAFMRSNL